MCCYLVPHEFKIISLHDLNMYVIRWCGFGATSASSCTQDETYKLATTFVFVLSHICVVQMTSCRFFLRCNFTLNLKTILCNL